MAAIHILIPFSLPIGLTNNYCRKNKLYSATDFTDALAYFIAQDITKSQVAAAEKVKEQLPNIKMLDEKDILNLKIKPQIRDVKVYQQIVSKEIPCNN